MLARLPVQGPVNSRFRPLPPRNARPPLRLSASNNRGENEPPFIAPAPEISASEFDEPRDLKEPQKSKLSFTALLGFSGMGVAETAYLTWAKLAGQDVVCPISGCDSVLNSSYSELFGIPLSFFGMLAYGAVAATSAFALTNPEEEREKFSMPLALGTSILSGTSLFLIYLLQTEFQGDFCAWCYGSATLSFSLLVTLVAGLPMRKLKQVSAPSLAALASVVFILSVGSSSSTAGDTDFQLAYVEPRVTSESSEEATQLAKRLRDSGAHMFGAFWCSHCYDEKEAFGKQALADFPYVECFPNGWKRGVEEAAACREAGVRAFPTWVINGKKIEGELTFQQLDEELRNAGPPAGSPASP